MMKVMITIAALIILAVFTGTALADYQTPTFPTCTNPQGTVISQYDTGTHAIPGADTALEGADTVYKLDDTINQAVQCYCPPQPQTLGIQTNWLRADTLTEEQKQQLQNNGWIYIANGPGLANAPYMAQNSTYACTVTAQVNQTQQIATPSALILTPTPTICATPSPSLTYLPSATQSPIASATPTIQQNTIASTSSPTPTEIIAIAQAANETNTTPPSSGNSSSPNSPSSSPTTSSPSPTPTSLPNTGGSIELYASLLAGIASFGMNLLLKKIS